MNELVATVVISATLVFKTFGHWHFLLTANFNKSRLVFRFRQRVQQRGQVHRQHPQRRQGRDAAGHQLRVLAESFFDAALKVRNSQLPPESGQFFGNIFGDF